MIAYKHCFLLNIYSFFFIKLETRDGQLIILAIILLQVMSSVTEIIHIVVITIEPLEHGYNFVKFC